jgi:hypothetical protein
MAIDDAYIFPGVMVNNHHHAPIFAALRAMHMPD